MTKRKEAPREPAGNEQAAPMEFEVRVIPREATAPADEQASDNTTSEPETEA